MRDHSGHITMHNFPNTGPVINYIKLAESGEELLTLYSSINTPAVGAAFVIKSFRAKGNNQISLNFGDLISVIDKSEDSDWWRGKRQYEVGYFPSDCVELIGSNVLNSENLEQLIKQNCTGSLRFKQSSSSNNENENPLVNLLKFKQLEDENDEKLTSTHKVLEEKEQQYSNSSQSSCNHEEECVMNNNRNDKKPLIEWPTNSLNSMNIKQNCCITPKTRNLQSILSLNTKQTDHHSFLKSSSNSTSSNFVFQRRNRISSTLPKSLTTTNKKPLCTDLFNKNNLNSRSFDTPDKSLNSFLSNESVDSSSNKPNNNLSNLQSSSSYLNSSPLSNNCSNNIVNKPTTNSSSNLQMMGDSTGANKRGKLSSFFRSIINRNSTSENQFDKHGSLKRQEKSNVLTNLRIKSKKFSISKNKVFGCNLDEYLNRTRRKIPLVLESCCEFLEQNGIIHGVYRLSGVNSNLQKLIKCFDSGEKPDFNDEVFLQDIHCVSSLLKFYFRELPNPLLTFELYEDFVKAIQPSFDPTGLSCSPQEEISEKKKLVNLIKVLKMLPLNHYVTLEYLIKHLNRIASHSEHTGMTIKNLAIVWSPNLLRSKELEQQAGIGALQCIAIQAVLTEYLIRYVNELFADESRPFNYVDYFNSQEDNYLNDSSLIDQTFNQLNSFEDQTDLSGHSREKDQLQKFNQSNKSNDHEEEEQLELDENHFEDNQGSDIENSFESKFVIKQDRKLIPLQEAQMLMKKKLYGKTAFNDKKTIDQLLISNLNDESESKSFFNEPCLSFGNKSSNDHSDNSKNEDHDDQRTFGVLGKFGSSSRGCKRFGNLDLVDEIDLIDDEPLQDYQTISNTKHFFKNQTSTPKESSSSSNLFKRNKWKPSVKL